MTTAWYVDEWRLVVQTAPGLTTGSSILVCNISIIMFYRPDFYIPNYVACTRALNHTHTHTQQVFLTDCLQLGL